MHRNLLSFEEEARAAQQQESSLNAATAEAIFSDALWKSPTSLGCLMWSCHMSHVSIILCQENSSLKKKLTQTEKWGGGLHWNNSASQWQKRASKNGAESAPANGPCMKAPFRSEGSLRSFFCISCNFSCCQFVNPSSACSNTVLNVSTCQCLIAYSATRLLPSRRKPHPCARRLDVKPFFF